MKKVCLFLSAFLLMSTTALAAPLDDYSKGNYSLGMQLNQGSYSLKDSDWSDSRAGMGFNLTAAVAKNIAVEADFGFNNLTTSYYNNYSLVPTDIKETFFNLDLKAKYMVFKNNSVAIAPYVGLAYDSYSVGAQRDYGFVTYYGRGVDIDRISPIAGVTTVFTIANFGRNDLKLYGDIGVGTNGWKDYKVGLSYEIQKKWSIDVGYGSRTFMLKHEGVKPEFTKDGWFIGVTYKF